MVGICRDFHLSTLIVYTTCHSLQRLYISDLTSLITDGFAQHPPTPDPPILTHHHPHQPIHTSTSIHRAPTQHPLTHSLTTVRLTQCAHGLHIWVCTQLRRLPPACPLVAARVHPGLRPLALALTLTLALTLNPNPCSNSLPPTLKPDP